MFPLNCIAQHMDLNKIEVFYIKVSEVEVFTHRKSYSQRHLQTTGSRHS